jgi:hypothetical protein
VWGSGVRVPLAPPLPTAHQHTLENTFDDNFDDNLSGFASVDIVRRKQRAHQFERITSDGFDHVDEVPIVTVNELWRRIFWTDAG